MAMNVHALRKLLAAMEAEEAAEKISGSKHGGAGSFNNYGNGPQSYTGSKVNSGTYAGDGNSYNTYNNQDGKTINNSGTFNGHGNGGFIGGNFDASTRNFGRY